MTVVRAGGYQGAASVHTLAMRAFGESLAGLSHGAMRLEFTANVTGDGSPATSLLDRVAAGELELCYFASSYLAERAPALAALDVPFAVTDRDQAYRQLDGRLGAAIVTAVRRDAGYRVLGFWDNGFRHLSNRLRPIRGPQDCRGMTIRTLDNAVHHAVFASFGFTPLTVDVRDLVDAVRSGRVDAQENPLTNTVGFGLQAWHRHHSLTGHFFGVALLLANGDWFDGIPAATQSVICQAAKSATKQQRALAAEADGRGLAALQAAGAEVLQPREMDMAAFHAAAAPVRDRLLQALDPALQLLLSQTKR